MLVVDSDVDSKDQEEIFEQLRGRKFVVIYYRAETKTYDNFISYMTDEEIVFACSSLIHTTMSTGEVT